MIEWSIFNGVSRGPGRCALILRVQADEQDLPVSVIARWDETAGFDFTVVQQRLHSIVAPEDPGPGVLCMAQLGTFITLAGGPPVEDQVDPTTDGPERYGFLTDLRLIGEEIYAAGMSRQVYRRGVAGGPWKRADDGIRDTSHSIGDVTAILTIDGRGEEVWAAGYDGEMWLLRAGQAWQRISVPTNLNIYSIRVAPSGEIVACGQDGTLLRGHGSDWQSVDQSFHAGDLNQLEFFAGVPFVSADRGIFRIDSWPQVDRAVQVQELPHPYRLLSAGAGALWTFGTDVAAVTVDGLGWRTLDLTPVWSYCNGLLRRN